MPYDETFPDTGSMTDQEPKDLIGELTGDDVEQLIEIPLGPVQSPGERGD